MCLGSPELSTATLYYYNVILGLYFKYLELQLIFVQLIYNPLFSRLQSIKTFLLCPDNALIEIYRVKTAPLQLVTNMQLMIFKFERVGVCIILI